MFEQLPITAGTFGLACLIVGLAVYLVAMFMERGKTFRKRALTGLLVVLVVMSVPAGMISPVEQSQAAWKDTTSIVDDFSDGDLAEYNVTDSTNTTVVSNGIQNESIQMDPAGGHFQSTSSVSGLSNYPDQGETFTVQLNSSGAVPMFKFATQSNNYNPDGYRVVVDPVDNEVYVEKRSGGSETILKRTTPTLSNSTTYLTKVYWGTDGTIDVTVKDSSGVVTHLKTNDTTFTDGGIAWEASGKDANTVTMDEFEILQQENSLGAHTVKGQVVNQHGEPVSNATVQVYGVNYDTITTRQTETKEEAARDLIQNVSSPVPEDYWQPDLQLADSYFPSVQEDGGHYALVTTGDVSGDSWFDSADLSNPQLAVPADTELKLTAWDADGGQGITTIQGEYDSQSQGVIADNKDIVVERLDPSGDVVDSTTLTTDEEAGGGWGDPSSMEYATTKLDSGFYRVYVEGAEQFAYTVKVGNPIANFDPNIQTPSGEVTKHTQLVQKKLDDNKLEKRTVKTGPDGHFSLTVPGNVKTVGIQAYSANGRLTTSDPTTADLRQVAMNTNASIVISQKPVVVDVPKTGVQVDVYETSFAPYQNLSSIQDRINWLEDYLKNNSFGGTTKVIQERVGDISSERLQTIYSQLSNLAQQNDDIEQTARERLKANTGNETLYVNPSDASKSELQSRISALQYALANTESTIGSDDPTKDVGQDKVSLTFPFDTDLNPDQVAVLVHYSNGTTKTLGTDSQYVLVEDQIGGDAVQVQDYPLGNNSAPVANFEVQVANSEGTGSEEISVRNPTFSGEVPGLKAIQMSTIHPGPNETVRMNLHPQSSSKFGNISNVTVYGPDGTKAPANVIDRDTANFTTSGAGVYLVKTKYTNPGGQPFTVTTRVAAGDTDIDQPPSMRVASSPYGLYAITGDGLEGGDVNIKSGGSEATFTAQIPASGDIPPEIHVYTSGADLAPDSDMTVRVVKGESMQSVSSAAKVILHTGKMPDDTLIRRNGEPLPYDKTMPYGNADRTNNGTVIETITDDSGTVDIKTNTNPNFVDKIRFRVEVLVPDVGSPLTIGVGLNTIPGGASGAALFVVVPVPVLVKLRRRWLK